MKRIINWLFLFPVAVVGVVLAVANRTPVTVSIDPFNRDAPAFAATVPLYAVVFAALIAGVLIGGATVWFKQGLHRRRARKAESDLSVARAEAERLRTALTKSAPADASSTGLPVAFDRTAA